MARKQANAPKVVIPQQKADDFTLIKGIGPILAGRLHKAGFFSYEQLGSLSPEEISNSLPGLSVRQITRQDWNGQARKLAPKKLRSRKKAVAISAIRQHYENFTIECLLDEKNKMRRTRVVHVQSGDADTWAGWEAGQLINFIARHAQIQIPPESIAGRADVVEQFQSSQVQKQQPAFAGVDNISVMPHYASEDAKLTQSKLDVENLDLQSKAAGDLDNTLDLKNLKATLPDSDLPVSFLRLDQQYSLQFTLDLASNVLFGNGLFHYQVTVRARQMGGSIYTAGEGNGQLYPHMSSTHCIPGTSLPRGTYRLEAFVIVAFDNNKPGHTALLKGDLLQIY